MKEQRSVSLIATPEITFTAGLNMAGNVVRRKHYLSPTRRYLFNTSGTDCDNRIAPTGTQTPIYDCSMPCAGDSTQKCGAGGRLNIYWNGETPPAGPQPLSGQLEGGWSYSGCYVDGAHGRVLTASPLYNSVLSRSNVAYSMV
jgi:hypothetical protein